MSTTVIGAKLNLDIGNFKSKMNDAKKSIQDLQKSIKDSTGKDFGVFGDSKVGKKIEEIKTKAKSLGQTINALPGPVKAIAGMATLGIALKQVYEMGKQRFFTGLEEIKDTISPVLNGIVTSINTVKQAFTELTGFNFSFSSIITEGANFEQQMKTVATIAGSVGTELQQLTDKARELGASTSFTATEVGQSFEYMGKHTCSVMEKSIA